jgi:hypothetical protein
MVIELGAAERANQDNHPGNRMAELRARVQLEATRDQRLKLEGKTGRPSRCGEFPAFGEGFWLFVLMPNPQGWPASLGQTCTSAESEGQRREFRKEPTGAAVGTRERTSLGVFNRSKQPCEATARFPPTRCIAPTSSPSIAQRIDQQDEGRRGLAAAGVEEMLARERRAPVVEHPGEAPRGALPCRISDVRPVSE